MQYVIRIELPFLRDLEEGNVDIALGHLRDFGVKYQGTLSGAPLSEVLAEVLAFRTLRANLGSLSQTKLISL